ncbi:MAG: hypothetical protein ACK4SZ_13760 [Allosphingosinicella sp.]|uniref:hypothetical protein n=1 Tax=Allosphingosinicella sp. TaxID=2823234 RepID=UPI00395861E9
MKPAATVLAAAALLGTAACGTSEPTAGENVQSAYENQADALEEAADVSHPAAQPILENGADELRARGENLQEAIDEGEAEAGEEAQ